MGNLSRATLVLNEQQAGVAIEGVVRQERIATSQLAVDSHGDTDFAMGLSRLLGFDLRPRLKDPKQRQLHVPRGMPIPDKIASVCIANMGAQAQDRDFSASGGDTRVAERPQCSFRLHVASLALDRSDRRHSLEDQVKTWWPAAVREEVANRVVAGCDAARRVRVEEPRAQLRRSKDRCGLQIPDVERRRSCRAGAGAYLPHRAIR